MQLSPWLACNIILASLAILPDSAAALQPIHPPLLETVQVTATRIAQPSEKVPAALTIIEGRRLQSDTPGVNISEKLLDVPGVLARERQNHAQDVQISIRGFGARSTFGIRGLRLVVDGIPATMPDGQGQVSNIDLSSTGRIEVLRGPFSALHGNAAGGVIQVFTADGADEPGRRLALNRASDDAWKAGFNVRGAQGRVDYNLDASRFRTDGFREHSRAGRDWFNARVKWTSDGDSSLSLVANRLWSPEAQDPLGLTATQMAENPRQAATAATAFDTRKALDHAQLGVVGEHAFAKDLSLRLMVYAGERQVTQFLAVPVGAQSNPLHGGGVIDLDSDFHGLDARIAWQTRLFDRDLSLVVGASDERQVQRRLGFENFLDGRLGVRGRLRRDQRDRVSGDGQYAQATWSAFPGLGLTLGIRRTRVEFDSDDHFITGDNPDDSGRREFSATSPVAGASFQPAPWINLYASYGEGFETPTFDELGYRSDGQAGLNFSLQAANTRSGELGAKARIAGKLELQIAAFRADTDDELAVATNAGGRSTFQNAGRASREGLELALAMHSGAQWRHQLAYTLLDARFRDAFLACSGIPCPAPDLLVAAGTPIPGVPRTLLHLASAWENPSGWYAGMDVHRVGAVRVSNANPLRASAYTATDLHVGHRFDGKMQGSRIFLRIGNALDRQYAGSVIVNETSGRYFEPAPGRNVLLGMDWRW